MGRSAQEKMQAPDDAMRALTEVDCLREMRSSPLQLAESAAWDLPTRRVGEDRLTRLVKTIEDEIIPRLVKAHRALASPQVSERTSPGIPTAQDVDAFVKLVMARDDAPMFAHVTALQHAGLSIETIYLDLLAPAAQRFHELWMSDTADFTEVTVGVGRLQQVLRELSPAFGAEVEHPFEGRRALLVPAPGEHHTFGLSIVSEFFRRAGWEVIGGVGGSRTDAVDMARREWFDVVGFSVGSEARLEWLHAGISSIRETSRNPSIAVLVGGPVFQLHPEYVAQVGADDTAADALQATIVAESLVAQRVRRPLNP